MSRTTRNAAGRRARRAVRRASAAASLLAAAVLCCLWLLPQAAPTNLAASGDAGSTVSAPGSVNSEGWTEFDAARYPDYYRIIDKPCDVDVELPAGVIQYGEPDELGRTTRVVANVTPDMVEESKGWRAGFAADADDISGWGHNGKASIPLGDGRTYNGWFWNRSHLLADALGGYERSYDADGNLDTDACKTGRRDLICGTRTQNVGANDGKGGMQYFENAAVGFLEENPQCSVWYSARPVYEGDELVPRSVIVTMRSCNGRLDLCGEVFNAAEGYVIDYSTGRFHAA